MKADYSLFEQVVDIANASYTSALGNTRQHDVISAQLELVQLQDKLEEKKRVLSKSKAALSQWLIKTQEDMSFAPFNSSDVQVSAVLPEISINHLSQLKKHDFSMSFVLPCLLNTPQLNRYQSNMMWLGMTLKSLSKLTSLSGGLTQVMGTELITS